jgi:hypothetical protein
MAHDLHTRITAVLPPTGTVGSSAFWVSQPAAFGCVEDERPYRLTPSLTPPCNPVVVRNNSLVPRHTHDVEPAAHRFSIVPPPTPSSSGWGVIHGRACKPCISTWNFRYLSSPRVEPSSRLRGVACELVELCKHPT